MHAVCTELLLLLLLLLLTLTLMLHVCDALIFPVGARRVLGAGVAPAPWCTLHV